MAAKCFRTQADVILLQTLRSLLENPVLYIVGIEMQLGGNANI